MFRDDRFILEQISANEREEYVFAVLEQLQNRLTALENRVNNMSAILSRKQG